MLSAYFGQGKALFKLCGLRRQEDLDLAASLGVQLCGFIFHAKSPRSILPAQAAELHSHGMLRVGVFVGQQASEIKKIMAEARLNLAQLHGAQALDCAAELNHERVIRVLWPESYASKADFVADIKLWAPFCTAFLLDAGKFGGGHSRALDWASLREVDWPRPWILAGGLGPETVQKALAAVRPNGLDFNSGVEQSPGCKDATLLCAALASARGYYEDSAALAIKTE